MTDSMDDFELNIVPGIYGQVEIVSAWDGNVAYLLDNGIKWNAVNLKSMKTFNELYSSQDLAYGDVLITGLGFGIIRAMGVGYVPVTQERPMVSELSDNFEQFWLEYVEKYFPEERFFLEMDLNKVKKYVIKFYTRNMG
jgi:hypothetical protein